MVTPVQSQRYAAQVKDFTEAEHRAYYEFLLSGGKAEDYFQNVQKHLAGQHDQSTHGRGGVHGTSSRKAFWNKPDGKMFNDKELKASVAKQCLDSMHKMGITYREIYASSRHKTVYVEKSGRAITHSEIDAQIAEETAGWTDKQFADKAAIEVNAMVRTWGLSSTDPDSVYVQQIVQKKFGLEDTAEMYAVEGKWGEMDKNKFAHMDASPDVVKVHDAFVQVQYDQTQEFLKSKGITEITVYRGTKQDFSVPSGTISQVSASQRPLSAWSIDLSTAQDFASGLGSDYVAGSGSVFRQVIPASKVFAVPMTGSGCYKEYEVIVLGGTSKIDVVAQPDYVLFEPDDRKRN
jgi:hypothetical protein